MDPNLVVRKLHSVPIGTPSFFPAGKIGCDGTSVASERPVEFDVCGQLAGLFQLSDPVPATKSMRAQ
jgi:hypothetical protein